MGHNPRSYLLVPVCGSVVPVASAWEGASVLGSCSAAATLARASLASCFAFASASGVAKVCSLH